ncbi:MAG: SpoIID/LytB domain-containing protein [Okeania sp. SIO2G4]|uniref:SpoIID/LytB domain-containing protein n=1 Tax=unclassified Okeania TaxID=2634635 RepID=UPI0013BB50EC|nr:MULTISPECIES: SpoIID/LytB domain-containing protein [unclassified Okeania]NEP05874.1 SpoIID/LytB domain-containing protein [Okeania sp. SIO4D6]NEP38534.1 SpoIID/LytB domain-containing protein [Okeania sp. SIO2H7]NEP71263.1 SpoIID/LytB domain-containing protein [Okeania sp. SIO2G5]NEP96939.1 SpoIID/LytB domain-containing protein [Okeania sp. SIO2F5]NEQ90206.1 SpoIID/LytB domain-containing protein [Okeania sp. SIO2G4]
MSSGLLFISVINRSIKPLKHYFWTSILFWLLAIAPAQASLVLRIAIQEGAKEVKVGSSTNATIRDGAGRAIGELQPTKGFVAELKSGKVALANWVSGQMWIEPKGEGYVWIGDQWYRGRTHIIPSKSGVTAINYIDIEQYLYSVIGAEMNGNWPQEALKAQAVAARSYALNKRQENSNNFYDLGNDQLWQVYQGIKTESQGTYAAVDATKGQVLTYNGQIILALFHSSSGGHTENVEDVWSNPLPYLRAVPDFDQDAPVYEWTESFTQAELKQRISGVGNIISMTPQTTTPHNSVITIKVLGDAGVKTLQGTDITAALGLKSTRFIVTPNKDEDQQIPSSFKITGKGFGHAVGMSQWGAYNLARNGYNYQQILLYYYQGANLARIDVR